VNWQGKASLYYSSDMKEWDLMQADAPLMDVASGSDRLTLNTINISLSMVINTRAIYCWCLISRSCLSRLPAQW
jgi:hypothetical protein